MAFLIGILAVLLLALPSCGAAQVCKAVPGAPEWPSADLWQQLNATVGGRLIDPSPPAAVCHADRDEFDTKMCQTVTKSWASHEFHSNDPLSSHWNQYNNDTCLPDPYVPCTEKGYSAYVVNATTAEHVKHAVDFARVNNVRLVVKNTGHDYLGRSAGLDSLSIWTHYMTNLSFDDDSFTPQGCGCSVDDPPEPRVVAGPGNQFDGLYKWLDQYNYTIIGGSGLTVGLGGYLTGGGHGVMSSNHGLGADQILEVEMVTPNGDIIIANECQNTDLFWAVRGGGGSTFGVITSFTIKAIPTPKIVAGQFAMTAAPNSSVAVAIGSLVLSRIPDMVDMGGSGYMWSLASGPSPAGNGSIGGIYGVLAVEGSEDVTVLDRIWEPIVAEAKRRWGSAVQFQSIPAVFPSLYAYVKQYHDTTVAGTGKLIDTRLLSASAMRDEPAELTAANECAVRRGDNEQLGVMVVAGKGLHEAEPRGGDNAVHPFWRKSVALLAVHKEFGPFDAGARQAAVESVNGCMEHLRKLEPESGAYVNEALRAQPDWQHVFFGDKYERLADIKKQVDPTDVLWCEACVGSEGWEEVEDGQLCQV